LSTEHEIRSKIISNRGIICPKNYSPQRFAG
jgi:hypothetical protein